MRRSRSAIDDTPPEAITGVVKARASAAVAATLAPSRVDIGIDDGGNAGILETPAQLTRRQGRGLGPTLDGHPAATSIDADGDLFGKLPARRFDHYRIFHRGGAQNDPRNPGGEPHFDRRQIADAAAQLDSCVCLASDGQNPFDRGPIYRRAGKRAVQIDNVEPRCAGLGSSLNTVA